MLDYYIIEMNILLYYVCMYVLLYIIEMNMQLYYFGRMLSLLYRIW